MNSLSWLNWFNREKLLLLTSALVLVLGALFPWYQLPPQVLNTFATDLSLINANKVLAALFALLSFSSILWFRCSLVSRLSFWSGLIAVLLFPYLITTWSPPIAFITTSYHSQQAQVTDHVEVNFPEVQAQWKQNILLAPSSPTTSTYAFAIKDSYFFQINSWDKLVVEGFGYNNYFFAFIGAGWGFSIMGFAIGLIAIYIGENQNFDVFLKDIGKLFPWLSLGVVILVFSMVLPNFINYQLDTLFAKSKYHQVVATSHTLASWYPPISGDTDFLERMATAGFYEDKPEPALIYFVKGLEHYRLNDLVGAKDYFQQSLAIQPRNFLVRGYLANSILNLAVENFNNHQLGAAADRFEEVLRIFPGHLEALYYLMLARVVNGEFEKSTLAAEQIIENQQYFHLPSLALLGQAYLHSAWSSYHKDDTTQAWKQYRQSIDRGAWK